MNCKIARQQNDNHLFAWTYWPSLNALILGLDLICCPINRSCYPFPLDWPLFINFINSTKIKKFINFEWNHQQNHLQYFHAYYFSKMCILMVAAIIRLFEWNIKQDEYFLDSLYKRQINEPCSHVPCCFSYLSEGLTCNWLLFYLNNQKQFCRITRSVCWRKNSSFYSILFSAERIYEAKATSTAMAEFITLTINHR